MHSIKEGKAEETQEVRTVDRPEGSWGRKARKERSFVYNTLQLLVGGLQQPQVWFSMHWRVSATWGMHRWLQVEKGEKNLEIHCMFEEAFLSKVCSEPVFMDVFFSLMSIVVMSQAKVV